MALAPVRSIAWQREHCCSATILPSFASGGIGAASDGSALAVEGAGRSAQPTASAKVANAVMKNPGCLILDPSSVRAVSTPSGQSDGEGFVPERCAWRSSRSEEHTSELQSRPHLVCRLL